MTERNRNNSPGLAKKLLSLMSVYCENHSIIEDFEETFFETVKSEGRFRAKCWYWGNALKSVAGYLKLILYWRFTMLKNHLIIAYRNFVRNKLYSFINVFGLAIGLSICLIISLWLLRELSYDRFHRNAPRIYRVERELLRDNLYSTWPITGGAYKQALIDEYPEIENAARFWRREFAVKDHKNLVHRQEMFAVDNSVFDMFDFHLEEGDEQTALEEPLTVVLTRKNAFKYFGTGEAIGKSLSLEWQGKPFDFKVTGILAEVPKNSHIHFDMLISIASYPAEQFANWRSNYLYTYILVRENALKNDLEEKLKAFVSRRLEPHYGDLLKQNQNRSIHEVLKMRLFPIRDIHLHPGVNWEIEPGVNILSVYIFSCVAALILVIACLNFVNLSTARAGKRAKEVSLRKTVGAEEHELRAQFIQESVLLAFVSLVLAFIMSSLFVKAYNGIFAENLSLSLLLQPKNLIILIGATFAVGVLAGLYPAYYLTRFMPVEVMKGGPLSGTGRPVFRRNLVIVQYCISIILMIAVITVYRQTRYMQSRSLGFDKENVVILSVRSQQIAQNYGSFRNRLMQSPLILSASASSEVPADSNYSNDAVKRAGSDEPINMIIFSSDYDYVDTYRMEILAGRTFSRDFGGDQEGTVILNEAAAHKIGWMPEEAIGKKLKGASSKDEVQVVGVVENFHFRSLRMEVEPMVLFLNPNYIRKISVRIAPGDIENILKFIKKTWETAFPGEQFEYSFLDHRINQLYESEMKMKDLFIIFSALSILVACLGLLGLVSFTAELKTKEIGIRKVLGASTGRVIALLSKEFVKWIMFANIVAWPLAWFMMNRWLQNFAYRINMGIWIYFVSAAFALIISLGTVGYQFIKAAGANPADSLRYE